jgi:4-diphosphocytidyl-2-C-methyl-D-erythritol kinase
MGFAQFAPAKVNLFLDVLSRRPDGYHDIGTVFQSLDMGDELEAVRIESGIEVRSSVAVTERPEDDLTWRAAYAVQQAYGVDQGIRLDVRKNLPMGAGLGGGSSDAAAAIRLAVQVWDLPWEEDVLMPLAARLGADVPFFLGASTAMAEGIGEVLTALPPFASLSNKVVLVLTPQDFVPTGKAYGALIPSGDQRWLSTRAQLTPQADWAALAYNKFEEWVLPEFTSIRALKEEMLEDGASWALLSGSGASVFGVFDTWEQAEKSLEKRGSSCRFKKISNFFKKNP